MQNIVLTSILDHLFELVIVLAVVVVLGALFLIVMSLCIFIAVFLAHLLSRPPTSPELAFSQPVEDGWTALEDAQELSFITKS